MSAWRRLPRPFRYLGCALLITAMLGLAMANAKADSVQINLDQAQVLRLPAGVATIVIGNPLIADAAVQDPSTIVLTGKGFGVTNLVVLDSEGAPIVDEQITVSRQADKSVRIYRRAQVQTLSCTPYCESAYKNEAEIMSESEMSFGQ